MKNLFNALVVSTVTLYAAHSFAVFIPTYDRPLLELKKVQVLESTKAFEDIQEIKLTLTRRDGTKEFNFIFEAKLPAENEGFLAIKHQLRVTKIYKDECNNTIYLASLPRTLDNSYRILPVEDTFNTLSHETARRVNLQVIDHSTSKCDDNKSDNTLSGWEAELSEQSSSEIGNKSTVEFHGNPETIFTLQTTTP